MIMMIDDEDGDDDMIIIMMFVTLHHLSTLVRIQRFEYRNPLLDNSRQRFFYLVTCIAFGCETNFV